MIMNVTSGQHVELKMSPSRMKMFEEREQLKRDEELPTKIPLKRSFDVAFLMLPDEKMKSREHEITSTPVTELSVRSDLMDRYHQMNKVLNHNRIIMDAAYTNSCKSKEDRYSTGSLNSTASSDRSDDINESDAPRSAFSKVPQIINVDSPVPPPTSPDDLSCSSASPPISYSPPSANFRSNYTPFLNSSAFQPIDQSGLSPQGKYKQLLYRGNSNMSTHNVQNNNFQTFHFGSSNPHVMMHAQPEHFMRNPAAAILSTLLPTTLGALSLPAQNVCAKCNISFRMTSDLVYHMRSHHKNENTQDPHRRKREEKLKCPVCSESFRERHHLTRHMTAHQDKEGDLLDHEIAEYHSRRK